MELLHSWSNSTVACDDGRPPLPPAYICTPVYVDGTLFGALGFNPHILEPMRDILFDEKIWGSNHLTLGKCYDIVGIVGSAYMDALARAGAAVDLYLPARPGEKPCGGAVPEHRGRRSRARAR